MKKTALCHAICFFLLCFFVAGAGWGENPTPAFTPLPLLKVQGNRIVDEKGRPVTLQGLNLCYPSILLQEGHWTEDYFREAAAWGARLVRVPIDPGSYRRMGKGPTLALLDQAAAWGEKYGMYVMVDWHSIGNPVSGVFQEPWEKEMKTDLKEMRGFWGAVSQRYKDRPTVAFYEVFNEPAAMEWRGGRMEWAQWRDLADQVIDTIYEQNPHAIPVVGGVRWAYDLRGVAEAPIRHAGVAYAAHPYPGHAAKPWEESWERDFGYVAAKYPVILTEFGFDPHDQILPGQYKADREYGEHILAYAKTKGMSWTAFVFYTGPGWPMPLFSDWNYTPTESGAFFKEKLSSN